MLALLSLFSRKYGHNIKKYVIVVFQRIIWLYSSVCVFVCVSGGEEGGDEGGHAYFDGSL